MFVYNLIEYSDNYSKTSGSLWRYYKDEPTNNLVNSKSFKFWIKNRKTTANGNTKDVDVTVPLKYFLGYIKILF